MIQKDISMKLSENKKEVSKFLNIKTIFVCMKKLIEEIFK